MAKRGYKLQEFLAHSTNVNCLSIGKKACRIFVTGGDDYKVNLWTIGKPTSLMSLSGHTSPVESVAFDSAEVLVLAGASSGVIKQWDLEEAKMVRTLSGHRSNCTAVEFHPFGEFFASGSMDTNLRLWDIRKKGCIHTYKGHTQGVSTIKFTPDGRWVVSGGFDNVVKVWDLTAGKLLHDFKFHEGHVRSLDFHPLEFLLATGSADRTVKFWDLETFELIGSTRPEATGVRVIGFHPDGRTLFSGLEDSLKVYSWEPVICHDAVDMGWSTLGDLCIHEGKLLGCSYYQNSVGVWVADVSLIEPYGDASQNDSTEQKLNFDFQGSSERVGTIVRTSSLRCRFPDYESKEIKNIYVDSAGGKPVTQQKVESLTSPKVPPHLDTKETNDQVIKKLSRAEVPPKSNERAVNKSLVAPSIVPRDDSDGKDLANSTSESITFSRTKRGMLLRPAHVRRPSNSKNDLERSPMAVDSGTVGNMTSKLDGRVDSDCQAKTILEDGVRECCEEKHSSIVSVTEKLEKVWSPQTPTSRLETSNKAIDCSRDDSVKFINGVAVVQGRTRTLVERFERREKINSSEDQASGISNCAIPEADKIPSSGISNSAIPEADKTPSSGISSRAIPEVDNTPSCGISNHAIPEIDKTPSSGISNRAIPEIAKTSPVKKEKPQISTRDFASANVRDATEDLLQTHDVFLSTLRSRLTKIQVVRHFWERKDIKGAINAMRKLPDHSVQADVISVLIEKMDILTLDLFSCLLPVLLGLLDSNSERHATLSLEMLLKLVAVFGPVIRSAISTPRAVGVDLHAEQRVECCNQCSIQLQKVQKILPSLVRKGGLVAKSALELSLVLQES
ncbi:Guanine nucleotide-binding protein, beta subunit [Parasponia andersonii]|uniref:Katanin p80 WD40 repeat-containing subunit B1 homolog n=1 Tax=Parasponia andersonii TaxID=3476 RepID=A0A2P5DCI1_PARAD|nr:Guanine nucleotide-binding protein, beta subunit [Parasponia andersonii]